jgi:hypothetical protein
LTGGIAIFEDILWIRVAYTNYLLERDLGMDLSRKWSILSQSKSRGRAMESTPYLGSLDPCRGPGDLSPSIATDAAPNRITQHLVSARSFNSTQ